MRGEGLGWRMLAVGVVSLGVVGAAEGEVVIGDFENGSYDGWIDWSSSQAPLVAPKFTFSNSLGVTRGSSALVLTQNGWNQNLSIKLQDTTLHPDYRAAFLANTQIQFDITLPASTVSGWTQIFDLALNAEGWGFTSLASAQPVPGAQWGWGPDGGGVQQYTVTFDYSAALAVIPANPNYVEFILATNNDGLDTHGTYHIDNIRLSSIPEPAALSLVGVAGLGLMRRRK